MRKIDRDFVVFVRIFKTSVTKIMSPSMARASDIYPATLKKRHAMNQKDQRLYDFVTASAQLAFAPAT